MNYQSIRNAALACIWLFLLGVIDTAHADTEVARAAGIAWLVQHQNGDGSWGQGGGKVAATAEALEALRHCGVEHGFLYARALSWMANAKPGSVDALARKIIALKGAGMDVVGLGLLDELLARRNALKTWGAFDGYGPGFPDASLAMEAVYQSGIDYADLGVYLYVVQRGQQAGNYGWSYMGDQSGASARQQIMPTAHNLLTLSHYTAWSINGETVKSMMTQAVNWLLNSKRQAEGSFLDDAGIGTGAVHKTALAYLAIDAARKAGVNPAGAVEALSAAQTFIIGRQQPDGSWGSDAYQTALALRALPAAVMPDRDGDGMPDAVEPLVGTDPDAADGRSLIAGNGLDPDSLQSADLRAEPMLIEVLLDQEITILPTATGGSSTYRWRLSGGTLPPGVFLVSEATGEISGIPTRIGSYSFTLTLSDAADTMRAVPGHIRVLDTNDGTTDSDGDGVASAVELAFGTDPLDSASLPTIAHDDLVPAYEDQPVTIVVLDNDLYPAAGAVSITQVGTPAHGSLRVEGEVFIYQPDRDFYGKDGFGYTLTVGGEQSSALVMVDVLPLNDDPVTVDDEYDVARNGGENAFLVLANDSDVDDDPLRISAVGVPDGGGQVVVNAAGDGLRYTPAVGFKGIEKFAYTVTDGNGGSAQGNVTVMVSDMLHVPLVGTVKADTLVGGDEADTIHGLQGDDTIIGRAGNDYLLGGVGSDIYYFARGDGDDTLTDTDPSPGNVDTVRFAAGIVPGEVVLGLENGHLVLGLPGGDRLTLTDWFRGPSDRIERVEFDDGTVWDEPTLLAGVGANATTSGNDELSGSHQADSLNGLEGDDRLYGLGGDDTLAGGPGHDYVHGGAGDDAMEGGPGEDVLWGDDGTDRIDGGDDSDFLFGGSGTDTLIGGAGKDYLFGGEGADTLEGGEGDDLLAGGAGGDTYRFNRGDGRDLVAEEVDDLEEDSLVFGAGIARDQLWFERIGDDLRIGLIGTEDGVTIGGWFSGQPRRVEKILTDDGSWLPSESVQDLVSAMAGLDQPPLGQLTLPEELRQQLDQAISGAWR